MASNVCLCLKGKRSHPLARNISAASLHSLHLLPLFHLVLQLQSENLRRNQRTQTRGDALTKHAVQKWRCGKQNRHATSIQELHTEAGSQKQGMALHRARGHLTASRPGLTPPHGTGAVSRLETARRRGTEMLAASKDAPCPCPWTCTSCCLPSLCRTQVGTQLTDSHVPQEHLQCRTFNGKTETSFQTPTLVPISANPAY